MFCISRGGDICNHSPCFNDRLPPCAGIIAIAGISTRAKQKPIKFLCFIRQRVLQCYEKQHLDRRFLCQPLPNRCSVIKRIAALSMSKKQKSLTSITKTFQQNRKTMAQRAPSSLIAELRLSTENHTQIVIAYSPASSISISSTYSSLRISQSRIYEDCPSSG